MYVKPCYMGQIPVPNAAVTSALTHDVQFMPNLVTVSFEDFPDFVKVFGDRGRAVARPAISTNTRAPVPPLIGVHRQTMLGPTSRPHTPATKTAPSSSMRSVIPATLACGTPHHFVFLSVGGAWANQTFLRLSNDTHTKRMCSHKREQMLAW